MPIYEYNCKNCGNIFHIYDAQDKKYLWCDCPNCNDKATRNMTITQSHQNLITLHYKN